MGKVYGQTSRDMRRLGVFAHGALKRHRRLSPKIDSVTRSPLYSIYGETISGVAIIRAFGAGSKFLRDMLRCVDTVSLLLFTEPSICPTYIPLEY